MIFPRKTVKVGNCIAVLKNVHGSRKRIGPGFREYSNVTFRGKIWRSHRLSFHLNCRAIPRSPKSKKSGFVLHTCDHKWCIKPNHLYLGTQQQNIQDSFKRHPTLRRNIQNWSSKEGCHIGANALWRSLKGKRRAAFIEKRRVAIIAGKLRAKLKRNAK